MMKKFLIIAIVLTAISGTAIAQVSEESLRYWNSLSDKQKDEFRRRFKELKKMSAKEREELKQRLIQFEKLAPKKRQEVIANYRVFKKLKSSEQRQILRTYRRYKRYSPHKRAQLRRALQKIIHMPRAARVRFLQNAKSWRSMTPQKRQKLRLLFMKRRRRK